MPWRPFPPLWTHSVQCWPPTSSSGHTLCTRAHDCSTTQPAIPTHLNTLLGFSFSLKTAYRLLYIPHTHTHTHPHPNTNQNKRKNQAEKPFLWPYSRVTTTVPGWSPMPPDRSHESEITGLFFKRKEGKRAGWTDSAGTIIDVLKQRFLISFWQRPQGFSPKSCSWFWQPCDVGVIC